jgi:hypothetical protein
MRRSRGRCFTTEFTEDTGAEERRGDFNTELTEENGGNGGAKM